LTAKGAKVREGNPELRDKCPCESEPIDDSLDPGFHVVTIEVQQEPELASTELQVAQHLSGVYWSQSLYGLDLYDHFPIDPKINAISGIEPLAVVRDGQENLTLDGQTHLLQFACQAHLVRTLQQAWAKSRMNLHRRIQNRATRFFL
jgi:hypothetical protein